MTAPDPDMARKVADEAEATRLHALVLANAAAVRGARQMPPDAVVHTRLPGTAQHRRSMPILRATAAGHPVDIQLYPTNLACRDPR